MVAGRSWIWGGGGTVGGSPSPSPGPGPGPSPSPGGSFSDSDWPTILNRPQIVGSVLTWVGPSGGGANNGTPVQQTRTLTTSGTVTTTANNQVIQGLNVTGGVNINHNNVTVKQCCLNGINGFAETVKYGANVTGMIVEDNYMNGQKASYEGICSNPGIGNLLGGTQNFIRRNYISGFENSITLAQNDQNVSITDNFITAAGNSTNTSYDGDFIELYSCNNVVIRHNMFDGTNTQTGNIGFTSFVNLSNLGPLDNITIDGNMFGNGNVVGSVTIVDSVDFGGGLPVRFSVTNNGWFNLGVRGYISGPTPYTITTNSGNYVAATITATSGTLINGGSGQV